MTPSAPPGPVRRHAAVLGHPIGHSLSPTLHVAAYRALGLDWTYVAIDCDVPALPATLDRLDAQGYAGLSLTRPLKEAVRPLLDRVAGVAADVGAVNTVVLSGSDRTGWNTDVAGVAAALAVLDPARRAAREDIGAGTSGPAVLVLGAGGAARGVLAALAADRSAAGPVVVLVRHPGRAGAVVDLGRRLGLATTAGALADLPGLLPTAALVVSTLPRAGADAVGEQLAGRLGGPGWPVHVGLFDLVYGPQPTRLLALARATGAAAVDGLVMLVAQAAEQVRLMTGRPAPVAVMAAAVGLVAVGPAEVAGAGPPPASPDGAG